MFKAKLPTSEAKPALKSFTQVTILLRVSSEKLSKAERIFSGRPLKMPPIQFCTRSRKSSSRCR